MKILMLNPPFVDDFCRSARWAAKSRGRVQRHPDWMLVATAVLEEAGHEVRFVDGAALNLKRADVKEILRDFRPDLAVLHTTTPSIYNDIGYGELAKNDSSCRVVLIGPHVSVLPGDTLEIAGNGIDAIIRGEYDYTLREIAEGRPFGAVNGVSYRENGTVMHTPDRTPLDVNELPFPAWRHIRPEWYRDAGKRFPFLTLLSGRGCFGRCTFCRDTPVMYGRKLRLRSPQAVVEEIEYDFRLFPYLKEIMFETDTFTASPKHVESVCEKILEKNLKFTWSCNVRVDLKLSLLPLMKKAGCRMLMIGFEFGTQKALDAVRKGITLEQSREFAEKANKLGFILHGCFMIGAPGEDAKSARATIDFAKSLPLDTIQISGICIYPGTGMYDWARKSGYLTAGDWNEWVDENYEQVTLLNYPQLSKKDIDMYIDRGLKEFYLRPGQIIKMALSVRNFSDLRRKLFGFMSFLNYFGRKKRRMHD